MGNSQFNSSKDGEGGTGRVDGTYTSDPASRTAPGAPGPFSDTGFAPALRGGAGATTPYSCSMPAGIPGAEGTGGEPPRDEMDVEPKAEEGEEEEEVCVCLFLCLFVSVSRILVQQRLFLLAL